MQQDLQFMLGAMNEKLDQLVKRANEDREKSSELEERLSKLETWRWLMTGAATAGGGVAGYLVKLFSPA